MRKISLADVAPIEYGGIPEELAAAMKHRKVISRMEGGPLSIDIDYNEFKAGLRSDDPVAYTNDEVCYISAGLFAGHDRGQPITIGGGDFMWRPAGSVSDGGTTKADSITICAFGPARADDWGHRLSPTPWSDGMKQGPIPARRHFSDVAPIPFPGASPADAIVHRVIFSREKDGSAHIDISHTAFVAGVMLEKLASARDEIWWVESGTIRLEGDGGLLELEPTDFFFRSAGEVIERLTVATDAVVISWSALPVV